MNRLLLVSVAIAASLASTPGNALTFNFSFTDNVAGDVSGTVIGEITGLVDNMNGQAATGVFVTSYPAGLNLTLSPTFNFAAATVSTPNEFDVSNRVVTLADFVSQTGLTGSVTGLSLVILPTATVGSLSSFVVNDVQNTILTTVGPLNITATPLPAALPLFATGIGAMGFIGWRRRRKAQAVG